MSRRKKYTAKLSENEPIITQFNHSLFGDGYIDAPWAYWLLFAWGQVWNWESKGVKIFRDVSETLEEAMLITQLRKLVEVFQEATEKGDGTKLRQLADAIEARGPIANTRVKAVDRPRAVLLARTFKLGPGQERLKDISVNDCHAILKKHGIPIEERTLYNLAKKSKPQLATVRVKSGPKS